jgi:hypothetical protein
VLGSAGARRCQRVSRDKRRQSDQLKAGRLERRIAEPPRLHNVTRNPADHCASSTVHDRVLDCLSRDLRIAKRPIERGGVGKVALHFVDGATGRGGR